MRREFIPAAALSLGITLASCGGSPEIPEEVLNTHHTIIEDYECDVDAASIEISDLSEASQEAFGNSEVGQARTDSEGITLDDGLSKEEMVNHTIHESLHWCADRKEIHSLQEPIELPGIGWLTGTDGFLPFINGDQSQANTFVEEGIVDWLAKNIGLEYTSHPEYEVLSSLTGQIAEARGFSTDEIIELLKTDDLVGLVGLMKNKSASQITGQDITDIFYLYMESYRAKEVPDNKSLETILES